MKIFISYRRAEDNKSFIVGMIHERLAKAFGKDEVFRDTYDIRGGTDWRAVLDKEVNSCAVMLVVMGPDWAKLPHSTEKNRLFDTQDVTRWEVETALRRSKEGTATVIPTLVLGASVPNANDLPDVLHPLREKHAINIRNFPDLDRDIEVLIRDIKNSQGFQSEDITLEKFEPKTIQVNEGKFWMGADAAENVPDYETPKHEVFLPTYRIGLRPVTNKEYEFYIHKTKKPVPMSMGWNGQSASYRLINQPVLGVSWNDAVQYCEWLSNETGRNYSLPNEAQWEKACFGKYPSMEFPENIYEWTCSLWGEKRIKPDPDYYYPWQEDGRNDLNANLQIRRVLRSFRAGNSTNRSGRSVSDSGVADARYGFRVVLSI